MLTIVGRGLALARERWNKDEGVAVSARVEPLFTSVDGMQSLGTNLVVSSSWHWRDVPGHMEPALLWHWKSQDLDVS